MLVSLTDGVEVLESDADGVADGLPDGAGLWGAGLEVVGTRDKVAVAVALARAVSEGVAFVVGVAVRAGVGVDGTLTSGEAGAEASGGGAADGVVEGVTAAVCDGDGSLGEFAVGRLTEGPLAVRLGIAGVDEPTGRALLLTEGVEGGNVADRLGAAAPPSVCPQPARTNPARATDRITRSGFTCCSRAWT